MGQYKLARDARGTATMDIEPLKPEQGPVKDETKPEPHTERLEPPKKPGMPEATVSPIEKPGEVTHAKSAITHPEDTTHPADFLRT